MNTQSIAKSMNGLSTISDGEITISEGSIIFSDGSGLDSSDDIAFKSLDNVMTGNNTFTGDNTFSNSLTTTGITNTGNFSNTGTINNMNFLKKANGFIISDTTHATMTGSFNNSIGVGANKNVSSGEANNAMGNNSMFSNVTGSFNTAVGQGSGAINQTGSYNTYLGASSQVLLTGYSYSTALGAFSQITDNNQVVLGRTNDTTYVKIPSTKASSAYTNGALVVDGGVGIAKDLRVNERCIINGLFAGTGAGSFQQGLTITGLLSCNTGVGITGNLSVSGSITGTTNTNILNVSGNLTVSGTTITKKIEVGDGAGISQIQLGDANHTVGKYGSQYVGNYWDTVNLKPYNGVVLAGYWDGVLGITYGNTKTTALLWTRDNGGCVGIFNNDPQYTLDVSGTFNVSGSSILKDTTITGNTTYTTDNTNLRWTGGEKRFKVEAHWSANDRYGLSFNALGQVRLHISNTYTPGYIAFGRALTDTTYMDLMKIAHNGDTSISSGTNSTSTTSGALVVSGGVGIASNLYVGGATSIVGDTKMTGVLSCGRNIGTGSIIAENNRCHILWNLSGGNGEVDFINGVPNSSFETGSAGFRFFNKATGETISNANAGEFMFSINPVQTYIPSTSQSTSTTTGALRVAGGVGIGKSLSIGGDFNLNNQNLYFNATSGTNKILKTPLYMWTFGVATNTTYSLSLSTVGLSNYLGYPFEIRVMFYPTNNTYPVYNITNQAFVFGYDVGYQVSYTDSNSMKLRTGDSNVAVGYNHTTLAYQAFTSGTYAVYIYP